MRNRYALNVDASSKLTVKFRFPKAVENHQKRLKNRLKCTKFINFDSREEFSIPSPYGAPAKAHGIKPWAFAVRRESHS